MHCLSEWEHEPKKTQKEGSKGKEAFIFDIDFHGEGGVRDHGTGLGDTADPTE